MRSLTVEITRKYGALVSTTIGISSARRRALLREGLTVPPVQRVDLLVDTGASHTMVDASVMRSLQLQPINSYSYHSTSTAGVPEMCEAYDAELTLGSASEGNLLRIEPLEIMANSFIGHHYQGLLGRDVLNRLQLAWRGTTRELALVYP